MPQLVIRGMEKLDVIKISTALIDDLKTIINCPREYFTMELIPSQFVFDGAESKGYPFVQVSWFDRGQEVQDKAAQSITKAIKSAGYENVDVFFTVLEEKKYYENGQHF